MVLVAQYLIAKRQRWTFPICEENFVECVRRVTSLFPCNKKELKRREAHDTASLNNLRRINCLSSLNTFISSFTCVRQ